jgi:predicted ABC-type ATPase
MSDKKIVIIAGPNGAGKTTFAREFLPNEAGCPIFVNADLIAQGLSPFQPENAAIRAGKVMLKEIETNVRQEKSFSFETTLSGKLYARKISRWRMKGYRVLLIYLSLPSVEIAISRVRTRVAQGGHNIPEDVIRRRFELSLKNFQTLYKPIVNVWIHYDNSLEKPILIDRGDNP